MKACGGNNHEESAVKKRNNVRLGHGNNASYGLRQKNNKNSANTE